jgi:predicted DNA-binding transcriptional regulator YafY
MSVPDEIKRTARVLEIIQLIVQAPFRYRRKDLAQRFEISERMIQKDLDIIRHGLKLTLLHTPEGYGFEQIPRLPAVQYSFAEALALLLAVQSAARAPGISSIELAAAVARLEALFPAEFSPFLHQTVPQASTTANRAHREQMLSLLSMALLQQRKVCIHYATLSRGGEINERVIRPYTIVPYIRSWQLVGYCEWRQRVLVFKIDRIQDASLLEETYTIPADFRLEEYLGSAWGMVRDETRPLEDILLRFQPQAGQRVAEEYWHPSQEFKTLEDGNVQLGLRLVATPEFLHWLLYYGDQVEVIRPSGLRDEVVREARRMLQRYDRGREDGE